MLLRNPLASKSFEQASYKLPGIKHVLLLNYHSPDTVHYETSRERYLRKRSNICCLSSILG